jgi:hypothetical protein
VRFILAACEGSIPNLAGNFVVVPTPSETNPSGLQRAINTLSQEGKANLLAEMLNHDSQTPELLDNLMQQAAHNPELFAEAAATLNLARYQQAHSELEHLIATSNREQDFQQLLAQHPWMFGSEYSERLANRVLTRGSQQDFVLRRTSDGYIELVEIKTPLEGRRLSRFDESHQSHYAGAALSTVVGQVQKYWRRSMQVATRSGSVTTRTRTRSGPRSSSAATLTRTSARRSGASTGTFTGLRC